MKKLAVFTAVLTATCAQVLFPDSSETNNGGSSSSSSGSNSGVVHTEANDAVIDRHFQLLQQGQDQPKPVTSRPQQLNKSPQQGTNQRGTNGNQCSTPDGTLGNCISFQQCSPFSNLNLRDPSVLIFLRESVCRLEQGRVDICCPPPPRPFPSPLFPSETECGQPYEQDRIIGGTEIQPGSYPWLVALGRPGRGRNGPAYEVNCGGTLITIRHVLSAAHCFGNAHKPSHARVGEHDVTSDNDGADPQTYIIRNFILAGYDEETNQNDVALLTLDRDVTYNAFVQPVCLPIRQELRNNGFVGNHLDIVGWGRTEFRKRQTSPVPLEAKVEVVPLETCKQAYAKLQGPIFISDRQVCAGTGVQDTCNGDSGGPLHYRDPQNGRYFLAGVTSFGVACGRPDFPGVYARVGSYLEWINNNVN